MGNNIWEPVTLYQEQKKKNHFHALSCLPSIHCLSVQPTLGTALWVPPDKQEREDVALVLYTLTKAEALS